MFKKNTVLKNFTTLKVGGPAEFFAEVTTEEELVSAIKTAHGLNVTTYVLGGGSNVLISDRGVSGLVIKNSINKLNFETEGEFVFLTVGAGEILDDVIAYTVERQWWGLENLSHIPGSVGATPVQNVGAYGVEVANLIHSVKVLDTTTLKFSLLTPSQCKFGYRDSIFKHAVGKKYIVTEVVFKLSTQSTPQLSYKDLATRFSTENCPAIVEIRKAIIEIRGGKFPDWSQVGTAGSFFKNPIITKVEYDKLLQKFPDLPSFHLPENKVKLPLGWVLDKICNLRGVQVGNVGTYKEQALVLVHNGKATAEEIETFAKSIQAQVFEKTGIKIEWEVTLLK